MTAGDDDLVVGDDDALRSRLAAMELELQRRAAWRRYATACGGAQADQAVFDAAWCAYLADRDAFLRRWRNVLALHAIAAGPAVIPAAPGVVYLPHNGRDRVWGVKSLAPGKTETGGKQHANTREIG